MLKNSGQFTFQKKRFVYFVKKHYLCTPKNKVRWPSG